LKRRLLNILAITSLVLVAGTLIFWIGNIAHLSMQLHFGDELNGSGYSMSIRNGKVNLQRRSVVTSVLPRDATIMPIILGDGLDCAGLHYHRFDETDISNGRRRAIHAHVWEFWFAMPWALAGSAALSLPWLLDRARRRWKSKPVGYCAICGYDMRATPERCPECGTSVITARTAARGTG
jgi:hypothetical protein